MAGHQVALLGVTWWQRWDDELGKILLDDGNQPSVDHVLIRESVDVGVEKAPI